MRWENYRVMKNKEKKCVLCGCVDHYLIGCYLHMTKKCSCHNVND